MKYAYLFALLVLLSCEKDNNANDAFIGLYILKSLTLENCAIEDDNVTINFESPPECIQVNGYEYCGYGMIEIAENFGYATLFTVERELLPSNSKELILSRGDRGVSSFYGSTVNLCNDDYCDQLTIFLNTFTYNFETLGCTASLTFEKRE